MVTMQGRMCTKSGRDTRAQENKGRSKGGRKIMKSGRDTRAQGNKGRKKVQKARAQENKTQRQPKGKVANRRKRSKGRPKGESKAVSQRRLR